MSNCSTWITLDAANTIWYYTRKIKACPLLGGPRWVKFSISTLNLNKSESPYLNGKRNITIDDYFAFDKQQYDANTARSDIKIINVTYTVIRVTNPTTNQTVKELPAKIIESVGRNLFTDEYETQMELITVNENTGYQFSDINIEDNEVLTDIPLIHLALREFRILQG